MNTKKNELLSPAGNEESFYYAISNGADAIYLGLDKFSARAYAKNFTIDNLSKFVSFAHLRNVKIYVTINTVIFDDELDTVYKTIDELAKIGVDAIIVQDLAVLTYISNKYKSIKAHASTQMGIDDFYAANFIKNLGATRIVLARETPLSTIKEIKEKLNIELETFIHGALCVSYSGNCLLSSMIGNRSGNRGRCAGCCRQLYSLIDNSTNKAIKKGYLLSLKDLNTSKYINDLSFIDSFKIEGRMKESQYVGGVTRTYRKLIDKEQVNLENLNKLFNRDFAKGYMFEETSENMSNIDRPNNKGYLIGEVRKVDRNKIWIKLFSTLSKGDQIRIENNSSYIDSSIAVTKILDSNFSIVNETNKTAIIYTKENVQLFSKVYKTKDINLIKEIDSNSLQKEYKKIEIDIDFVAKEGKPIFIKVGYKNLNVYIKTTFLVEPAINSPTTIDNIKNQFEKINDTPYVIKHFNIDLDNNVFIPLKKINELRREAIEKLDKERLKTEYKIKENLNGNNNLKTSVIESKNVRISVQVSNIKQYNVAKKLNVDDIYFENIIPRNNTNINGCENNNKTLLIKGYNGLNYYQSKNKKLVTDYSFNVTNYKAIYELIKQGVSTITLSLELDKAKINSIVENFKKEYDFYPNVELVIYGRIELMHCKYCLLKKLNLCGQCKNKSFSIQDKFESFPLSFNSDCTMSILSGKKLNLIDEIKTINEHITNYRLIFTDETEEEMISLFNSLKDQISNKNSVNKTFNKSKHTTGHFLNQVL